MDYEIMMNGNVRIGQRAPDFEATTTMGNISLTSLLIGSLLIRLEVLTYRY